jgi:hypothetical protein
LDEDLPNEDEIPHFLTKKAPPAQDDYSGRVGAFQVNEPAAGRVGAFHVNEPAAGRVGAFQVNEPAAGRVGAQWVKDAPAVLMDRQEINDAIECARNLRECCDSNNTSFAQELMELCREKQAKIVKTMQEGAIKMDDPTMEAPLNELMMLNDTLLEAIELASGKLKTESAQKAPSEPPLPIDSVPDPHGPRPSMHAATGSLDIDTLVNRKDVFSLICMLRAQGDKRLDAAMALMRYVFL